MALRPSLSLSNLLIRRVMRHRSVATLFRSAPPAVPATVLTAGAAPIVPAELDPQTTVVTAVPIAFPDNTLSQEPTPLPASFPHVPASPHLPTSPLPVPSPQGVRQAVPAAGEGESAAVPSPAPSLPVSASPSLLVPASSSETRVAGEGSAPLPAPSPIGARQAVPAAREGESTAVPSRVPPLPVSPSAPPDATITDEVWRRLRTIFQRHQARGETPGVEPSQHPEALPQAAVAQAPTTLLPLTLPPPAPHEMAAPFLVTPIGEVPDQALPPRSPTAAGEGVAQPATPMEPQASTVELPQDGEVRPLPLQSVWSVQQVAPVPPASPTLRVAQPHPYAEVPPTPEPLRQVLEQVAAGGITQSTIELIPPRRPRPSAQHGFGRAPMTMQQATADTEPQEIAEATPTPVQPQEEPVLIDTEIGPLPADLWELIGEPVPGAPAALVPTVLVPTRLAPEQPADTETDKAPADRGSADRGSADRGSADRGSADQDSADQNSADRAAADRDSADRAADLPARSSAAPTATAPPQPTIAPAPAPEAPHAAGAHLIQRTLAPSASAAAPTAPSTAVPTAAATPAPAPTSAAAQPAGGESPESGSASDIDVAELARRVYAEIKRRLSVERERSHSPWH